MRAICLLLGLASIQAAVPIDPCGLLTGAAIQKVIGEDITDQKPTVQNTGSVRSAQCFYTARTFTNSVSVSLTSALPGQKRDAAKEQWRHWFHRGDADGDHDKDRDRESRPKGVSEEEEEAAKAVPVAGVGDEAFWVHSFVGNLYVLKGNRFLRISLGGKLTDEERQVRAKALAAAALRNLR